MAQDLCNNLTLQNYKNDFILRFLKVLGDGDLRNLLGINFLNMIGSKKMKLRGHGKKVLRSIVNKLPKYNEETDKVKGNIASIIVSLVVKYCGSKGRQNRCANNCFCKTIEDDDENVKRIDP